LPKSIWGNSKSKNLMDLEFPGDPIDMITDQSFNNIFGEPRNENKTSETEAVTMVFPGDVSKIDLFESDNQKISLGHGFRVVGPKLQKENFLGGLADSKLQKKKVGKPMGGKFDPPQAKKRVKTNYILQNKLKPQNPVAVQKPNPGLKPKPKVTGLANLKTSKNKQTCTNPLPNHSSLSVLTKETHQSKKNKCLENNFRAPSKIPFGSTFGALINTNANANLTLKPKSKLKVDSNLPSKVHRRACSAENIFSKANLPNKTARLNLNFKGAQKNPPVAVLGVKKSVPKNPNAINRKLNTSTVSLDPACGARTTGVFIYEPKIYRDERIYRRVTF
jgi:hypothetical protein